MSGGLEAFGMAGMLLGVRRWRKRETEGIRQTSLVVQRQNSELPVQGIQVQSLVRIPHATTNQGSQINANKKEGNGRSRVLCQGVGSSLLVIP